MLLHHICVLTCVFQQWVGHAPAVVECGELMGVAVL